MNVDNLSFYLKHAVVDTRAIQSLSAKLGLLCSTFLCNNLINSYLARSMLGHARKLFDETPHRNVVTWSAIISGYTHTGNLTDALKMFRNMQYAATQDGWSRPNEFTFSTILTGCSHTEDLKTGIQIHCSLIKCGILSYSFVGSTLIDMYTKCGSVEEAWRVFDQTPYKDVVSWTAMLTCLANSPQPKFRDGAFGLFRDMLLSEVWPVVMTFASVVKIFDEPRKLNHAKQVHGCLVKVGIEVDDQLGSALIAMYGRCGGIDEAVRLSFRINNDVVTRTSLLAAFLHNGYHCEAIRVFREMIKENMMTDSFAIASVIRACSALEELGLGKEIHCHAVKCRFMSDVTVANALITLYGRCGEVGKAERIFKMIRDRDAITWTSMLTCYNQNNHVEEAIILFQQMLRDGISTSFFSFTGATRACSTRASFCMAEQMHSRALKLGMQDHLSVGNSLMTMYSKSGSIPAASRIFSSMVERDIVSWNALITGFALHGFGKETLELFNDMMKEGLRPDDYTFTGLLVSCSRAGLVAEGCEYFRQMTVVYGLEPKIEHYACMVDLLGRAGQLNNAIDFIETMPCDPDLLVLEALIASWKVHGNVEIAEYMTRSLYI